MVYLISTPANGLTAATGIVGCEGVVAVALVIGGTATPSQTMVQMAGGGFQLPAAVGRAEVKCGGAFQAALLRYTQALLTQTVQTAVCHKAGMMRYGQGHITIVDRRDLEARVCESYRAVQNEFTRLLGWVGLDRRHSPKVKVR